MLLRLQDKIKRDPSSYKEEFEQQYRHFESSLQIYTLKTAQSSAHTQVFFD